MREFVTFCPVESCEADVWGEVSLYTERQGDPIWGGAVTTGDIDIVDRDCQCVWTAPELEQVEQRLTEKAIEATEYDDGP